jgi:hypothetical protein
MDILKYISSFNINPWKISTLVELGIIAVLIKKIFKKKKTEEFYVSKQVLDSKHEKIDMDNVIESMFNAPILYDKLKKKIHPDRFPNDLEKNQIASELATQLNQFKNDQKKLNEIKAVAIEKLDLTF